MITHPDRCGRRHIASATGFTLLEVLVTFFVLLILAGVALPVTRNTLRDQRNNRAAQIVTSFIDLTRNHAIAYERDMGVVFERLEPEGFGRSACLRLRQVRGVPIYTGESAKAMATLVNVAGTVGGPINAADFNPIESQLLALSADMILAGNAADAPIRLGDRLELPGGRIVTILDIARVGTATVNELRTVRVTFNLREPSNLPAPLTSTYTHPGRASRSTNPPQRVRYAIHRAPVLTNTASVSLPRGTAIDLNYSGFGVRGSEFMPNLNDASVVAGSVIVLFDSAGRVSRVNTGVGDVGPPVSQLFFCIGDLDGVQSAAADLLNQERRSRANVLRTNASWLVLNPATGRTFAAPLAPVGLTAMTGGIAEQTTQAIEQARFLANLGDTLD